jgi:UrcA family protein
MATPMSESGLEASGSHIGCLPTQENIMRFAFLPLSIIALSSASMAQANEPERITARVSLAGIDLSLTNYRAEVDRRLIKAARRACIERSAGARGMTRGARQCIEEMLADGRAQTTRLAARATSAGATGRR